MPTVQKQEGVYNRPFFMVTASLWDKYEGHPWIKEVEVLSRTVDSDGRLRSKRLLTMAGKIPLLFRPFFGTSNPFYLMEEVVIDLKSHRMEVSTTNVNFGNIIDCRSQSYYVADSENSEKTLYNFSVRTCAFPHRDERKEPNKDQVNSSRPGRFQLSGLSRKIEEFVGGCLLGNVKQGELKVNEFMARLRSDCAAGHSKVWLCGMLRQEKGLSPLSA